MKTLQQHYERLMKALQGYKDQVDTWKTKVRTLQSDINAASAKRLKEMKQIRTSITKIEEFTATHTAMKNSIQQLDALKKAQAEEIRKIKENVAKKTEFDATEIQDSQKFINEQFEKLREDNRALKRQVDTEGSSLQNQIYEVAQEVEYNVKDTTRQKHYTREECLTVTDVPEREASISGDNETATKENCSESKKVIIDLCKELNLVVDPDKISIAHPLKKGRFSKGPRPIIVKFSSKEVCREVYDLRRACKEIREWGFDSRAEKIYINECLTPEKKKLLYDTKQAVNKPNFKRHGIIYVWTHRGDVYVRKNGTGCPKIRLNSQLELQHLVQGRTSLDTASNARSVPHLIRWNYVKDPWSLKNVSRPHFSRNHLRSNSNHTSVETHDQSISFEVDDSTQSS